jgi:hypothetical protein
MSTKIDTRPWNLGLPAGLLLAAACGRTLPLLPSEESDTDTDDPSATLTDPTENPDTTEPDECRNTEDCPPGSYCGPGGQCYDDYDYCDTDGYCCWDGCCDGGCHYYECYEDFECADGYECNYYECVPAAITPGYCDDIPIAFADPQGILEYEGAISLAFVDGNGTGDDIAIATSTGVTVVGVGGTQSVSDLVADGIAAGDIDGDGDDDLVVLSGENLHTFLGDPLGFVVGPTSATPSYGAARLTLADFDGNGALDVFIGAQDGTYRYLGVGGGVFVGGEGIAGPTCGFAAVANPQSGTDDLVYGESGQAWYLAGHPEGASIPFSVGGKLQGDSCPIGAGDFDADGTIDAAVLDATGSGGVTSWREVPAISFPGNWSPPSYSSTLATADMDLDGRDDIVLAGATDMTVRFGSSTLDASGQPLGCYVVVWLGFSPQQVVIGDFDGNGRRDIVGADGSAVWLAPAF